MTEPTFARRVVEGEITEYASDRAVPILHKAGEVARETHVTSH